MKFLYSLVIGLAIFSAKCVIGGDLRTGMLLIISAIIVLGLSQIIKLTKSKN